MRTNWLLIAVGLLTAVLTIGVIACGGEEEGAEVKVNLTEYIVAPKPKSVAAGTVTINAKNIGGTEHELVVIRTDLALDGLPTTDTGAVDESGEGVEVIDRIQKFAPGGEESITVDLAPGAYVLVCNVVQETARGGTVSHYQEGMEAAFEVTG